MGELKKRIDNGCSVEVRMEHSFSGSHAIGKTASEPLLGLQEAIANSSRNARNSTVTRLKIKNKRELVLDMEAE
jgi:hypothetical protein